MHPARLLRLANEAWQLHLERLGAGSMRARPCSCTICAHLGLLLLAPQQLHHVSLTALL